VRQLVRRLARESPRLLITGVATAAGQSALLVPIALLIRDVFDHAIGHRDSSTIVLDGVLVLLLYAAAAGLGYFSRVAALRSTTAAGARLRGELIAKVQALPQGWHDRQEAGMVHSLIVQDSQRVEDMLLELANPVLPAVLVTLTLTIVALALSPLLFLALLAVIPVFMFVAHVLSHRIRARAGLWLDSSHAFGAVFSLILRANTLTKVQGAEDSQLRRGMHATTDLASKAGGLWTVRAAHYAVQGALGAFAGAFVLVVGGLAVVDRTITLGDLLAFYAVLALLIRHTQLIGQGLGSLAVGLESHTRLERILAVPEHEPYESGIEVLDFRGTIELEGVTFGYEQSPILLDIDLVVRESEHVAVLGPNGAGKSTLVKLVVGLYRPDAGRLLADDVPFDEIDMRSFRRQIGVVLQDPALFPGTIRDNIAYGRDDASLEDIRVAAAAATAEQFIERLPQGYDTQIGDDGVGLSGGQRQRLAIARALLGTPRLLLLDEPTTYLDEASVTAFMANVRALPGAPTVVVVTHDPHAAMHADRIIELRDGRIVADADADAETAPVQGRL
jgi:ATP-binding cassette subfamily B protein